MLAPAEILQMEDYDFTPRRQGAKCKEERLKRQAAQASEYGACSARSAFVARFARANFAGNAERLGVSAPSFFAPWRLGVSPTIVLAAMLIAAGGYFLGHAAYIQAKGMLAQVLLEQAWETTLATGKPTKAWAWADTWPIARISFPSLDKSAVVLEEAGGEAMAFGPAHVAASAKPGASGVSVIGGHRDTHFNFIKSLKVGDEIVIETPAHTTVRYRMTGSAIVHAGASGIGTKAKTPRLALVTCYPFDAVARGPLRYVVFAEAK
jgi:sortase A